MTPERPRFVPDPDADREAMEGLQRQVARAARFDTDRPFGPMSLDGTDPPLVTGVDQAFLDDRAGRVRVTHG